ncbi:hypothetical protein PILCRDRAFT_62394, partial [Piloderma croceum F 1598]
RDHAHAAAALINPCEGVEHYSIAPYLDLIIERLLKLLGQATTLINPNRTFQEKIVRTLAMFADASEATFAKMCLSSYSLLDRADYRLAASEGCEMHRLDRYVVRLRS